MKKAHAEFIHRLQVGPAFLLLGQSAWALQDRRDPLSEILPTLVLPTGELADPRNTRDGSFSIDLVRLSEASRLAPSHSAKRW